MSSAAGRKNVLLGARATSGYAAAALLLLAGCAASVHGTAAVNPAELGAHRSAHASSSAPASSSSTTTVLSGAAALATIQYCTAFQIASQKAAEVWQTLKTALDSDSPVDPAIFQTTQKGLRSAADEIDKLDASAVESELAQGAKDYSGALRQLAADFDNGKAGIDAMNGHVDTIGHSLQHVNMLCWQ